MPETIADIIIPIHPAHQDKTQEAIESAHAQTVPCRVIPQIDAAAQGAAHTRNEGVRRGDSPFVVFLDADDILVSSFVEKCLAKWLEYQHGYVYTDWWRGVNIASAHEQNDMFDQGMYHIITTLLPRKAFEYAGGFDTALPTLEDEDLYRRLQKAGLCAWRVAEPLVAYRAELGQSAAKRDALLPEMERFFNSRDGHLKGKRMCSCQDNKVVTGGSISGQQMEGDILAMPLYTPRRMSSPTQAGRTYDAPMMGFPMWVNPNDVITRPDRWQPVARREEINPDMDTVLKLAGVA